MNATHLWFTTPGLTAEQKWGLIRYHRNHLLTQSDWTQLPDAPLTEPQKTAWTSYRRTLRDLPASFSTPDDVIFPELPQTNYS